MIALGDDKYKCSKHGFVITTTTLPIHCGLCGDEGEPRGAPSEKPEFPSLGKQAVNFGVAAGKHLLNKGKRVSEDDYAKRLEICNRCEHHWEGRCAKCGCFLGRKAWWESEDCPEGLWPK
jgi:hypothetical protein